MQLSLILNGRQALPIQHIDTWAEALKWDGTSRAYSDFVYQAELHNAQQHKRAKPTILRLLEKIRTLENELEDAKVKALANEVLAREYKKLIEVSLYGIAWYNPKYQQIVNYINAEPERVTVVNLR